MQVTQLDRELRGVTTALDRVTAERDHASNELFLAAREKVTALVNYAELSSLIHTCLSKTAFHVCPGACQEDFFMSIMFNEQYIDVICYVGAHTS
jgi:hypothetical protein